MSVKPDFIHSKMNIVYTLKKTAVCSKVIQNHGETKWATLGKISISRLVNNNKKDLHRHILGFSSLISLKCFQTLSNQLSFNMGYHTISARDNRIATTANKQNTLGPIHSWCLSHNNTNTPFSLLKLPSLCENSHV